MIDYKKHLDSMIDMYISHNWSFEELRREFCKFYFDILPEEILSDKRFDYYSLIQDKIELVEKEPSSIDKKDGLISEKDFYNWLKEGKEKLLLLKN